MSGRKSTSWLVFLRQRRLRTQRPGRPKDDEVDDLPRDSAFELTSSASNGLQIVRLSSEIKCLPLRCRLISMFAARPHARNRKDLGSWRREHGAGNVQPQKDSTGNTDLETN